MAKLAYLSLRQIRGFGHGTFMILSPCLLGMVRDSPSVPLTFIIMRKIESQMNRAILNCTDWKSGNTEVVYSSERDASYVYLYGNHIATVSETAIELYSCGYRTVTTKSRLNAILREHGNHACISQTNYEWFVYDDGNKIPFEEGMILR